MNDEFELESRLKKADPATGIAPLNEGVVARAPLATRKPRVLSYKAMRLGSAGLSAAALALVGSLALPNLTTPEPLFSLASGGEQTSMAAETSVASGKMASDMIWPGWIEYNYIADGLSDQDGNGRVYQAELIGSPEELLNKLANIFNVTGEAKLDDWATEEYPSYSITGENYSLNVYWSGTGNWSYNKWDSSQWRCIGSTTEEESQKMMEEGSCQTPQPNPELIPSLAEMEKQLNNLISDLDLKHLDLSKMTSYRDEWGASMSVPYVIDGFELPVSLYIGWDMFGNLSYISGSSFELLDRGEFKTISAQDAVSRISDWRWSGAAPQSLYEDQNVGIAYGRDITTLPAEDGGEVVVEPAPAKPSDEVVIDEAPAVIDEPMPIQTEPEIVELKINKSVETMLGVWDAKGGFWLVPGYALYNEQGWFSPIISLIEGVIALPEPMDYGVPMTEDLPATKQD